MKNNGNVAYRDEVTRYNVSHNLAALASIGLPPGNTIESFIERNKLGYWVTKASNNSIIVKKEGPIELKGAPDREVWDDTILNLVRVTVEHLEFSTNYRCRISFSPFSGTKFVSGSLYKECLCGSSGIVGMSAVFDKSVRVAVYYEGQKLSSTVYQIK